jgi:ribosomal protein S18 acetylase RimI-like enzyme
MKEPFTITAITAANIPEFYQVVSQVVEELQYFSSTAPPPFDEVERSVLRNIEQGYAHYIATANGHIVGWVDISAKKKLTEQHCAILGIGVLKEFRGKGIGKALLQTAHEHAWNSDISRIELDVLNDNKAAIALYKSHGYGLEGIKKRAVKLNDQYLDVVIMASIKVANER